IGDAEAAVGFLDEEGPSAAENLQRHGRELFLEILEASEVAGYFRGYLPLGLAALARRHDGPEKTVVGMASAVVENRLAGALGNGIGFGQDGLDGLGFEMGNSLDGLVQLVHIGGMMLAVVNLQSSLVVKGFQGVGGIRKGRESESHIELRSEDGKPCPIKITVVEEGYNDYKNPGPGIVALLRGGTGLGSVQESVDGFDVLLGKGELGHHL